MSIFCHSLTVSQSSSSVTERVEIDELSNKVLFTVLATSVLQEEVLCACVCSHYHPRMLDSHPCYHPTLCLVQVTCYFPFKVVSVCSTTAYSSVMLADDIFCIMISESKWSKSLKFPLTESLCYARSVSLSVTPLMCPHASLSCRKPQRGN